jgi:integrase
VKTEIEPILWCTHPPKTIEDLADRYCQENLLRPASRDAYRNVARVFTRDTGLCAPEAVTFGHVLAWRESLIQRASEITWNTYRSQMKILFNFAETRLWIVDNPFRGVKPIRITKKKKTVPKSLLLDALTILNSEDTPIQPGWFFVTMVKLFLHSGMRRRQLAALRWRDIDFERGTMLLTTEGSKTRREWEIPIPPQCVDDLKELWRRTRILRHRLEDRPVFWVQLFNDRYQGLGLTPRQITAAFHRLSKRLDRTVSAHRLRHTLATELAQGQRPDLKSLQYLLGHTSLATTMEYVHPEMDQLRLQLGKFKLK